MDAARPAATVGADRLGVATRTAAHVWALAPLGILAYVTLADRLSANPIEDVTRRLGRDALLMLTASLAVTPLVWLVERATANRSSRAAGAGGHLASAMRPVRRTFGLYAFFYASLHLFVFTVVDYGLDPVLLADAVLKKRYALVGLAAFVILTALAVTSTRGWRRRLRTMWSALHRLVYLAAVLVVLHNLWAAKALTAGRLAWAALIVGLLLIRVPLWAYDRQNSSADTGRP